MNLCKTGIVANSGQFSVEIPRSSARPTNRKSILGELISDKLAGKYSQGICSVLILGVMVRIVCQSVTV